MPNIKISQLPSDSNLSNSTLVPAVNNAVTVKTTISDIANTLVNAPSSNFQVKSNLTTDMNADGTSTTKYPSASAVKTYTDGLVAGLLSDRGNYTPSITSPGSYPTTGGRGPGGAPLKGDLWFIAANGYLGTTAVSTGQSVRALVDAPGQTVANWDILDVAGWNVAPEDSSNKVTSKANFIADGSSTVKYPSIKAVKDYIDTEVTLQDVITNSNVLTDNNNLQGDQAGVNMGLGVTDINAFGENAANGNTGSNVNALGLNAGYDNTGNNSNFIGQEAGMSSVGSFVSAMGYRAAKDNSGAGVIALGYEAGIDNNASSVNAIGNAAAESNSGNNSNFIGVSAGKTNSGEYVNAVGYQAAKDNTQDKINAIGYEAGETNTGAQLVAVGTAAGKTNTGNNLVALGESAGENQSGADVVAIGKNAGLNNTHSSVVLLGKDSSADGDSQLAWANSTGHNARLDSDAITGDRKVAFPNASGTMVLSVNGTAPNAAGDVTISTGGSLPYLSYVAYLNLSSFPTVSATQIYNTIGDGSGDGINDIAWVNSFGRLYANMSSAPFTSKTVVVPSGYDGWGEYYGLVGKRNSSSQCEYKSIRSGSTEATANTSGIFVEIRIYP